MISDAGRAGYALGREDQSLGKPYKDQEFTLTPERQLLIKREINKYAKKR